MTRFSAKAKKYWYAIGGIVLLIGLNYLHIEIPGLPDLVRDVIAGLIAAEGVYQAANAGDDA